ncbi:helix-turn-helix domain-containing protein [Streptomyces xanthophaeus]|uniref:helix-turn-helix domain-containing protein n=1 Tax=Streptomyces xanthophaeus TaxID=67385 RepID=UPI00342B098B
MSSTAVPQQTAPQRNRVTTRGLGFLEVVTVSGAAQPLATLPAGGCAASSPHLVLGLHTRGRARIGAPASGGGDRHYGPGEVFVVGAAAPLVLHETEDFELHLVRIPHRVLALTDRQVRHLGARGPHPAGPVAPLLARLLRTVLREFPAAPRSAAYAASAIAELVTVMAVLADEDRARGRQDRDPDPAPGCCHRSLLGRLRAHINDRLPERGLSPVTVAAAHHISVRHLHKLFAAHGSTTGRWIRHRRLEEARRELARPGRQDISLAAVAARWGFADAAHFSRSFRSAYGMPPSRWRAVRTGTSDRTTA